MTFDFIFVLLRQIRLSNDFLDTIKTINNRVIKKLAQPLSFPLSNLFNFSLTSGKVPLKWKEANVTPIFKKDDPSVVSNYRPISLLSTLGKVLEKIIHKHLFNSFKIITY